MGICLFTDFCGQEDQLSHFGGFFFFLSYQLCFVWLIFFPFISYSVNDHRFEFHMGILLSPLTPMLVLNRAHCKAHPLRQLAHLLIWLDPVVGIHHIQLAFIEHLFIATPCLRIYSLSSRFPQSLLGLDTQTNFLIDNCNEEWHTN